MRRRRFLQILGLAPAAAAVAPAVAEAAKLPDAIRSAVSGGHPVVFGADADRDIGGFYNPALGEEFVVVGDKFVIVGDDSEIRTSEDAVPWTQRTTVRE